MALINLGPSSIQPLKTETKRMLELKKEGSKYIVKINYSSLSIMQSCMKKADFALNRELMAQTESPALTFGSAIHAALEVFYMSPRSERVLPPNMEKSLELMAYGAEVPDQQKYLIFHATETFIERASALSHLDPMDKRSIPNGVWLLGEYFKTYIQDPYEVYRDSEGNPYVEKYLELKVYESPELEITLHGQIDLILENKANGQILVTDHKTSSQVGQDFYNRLKPNYQYTGYLLLAQQCLGIQTDQFMVNCLQTKAKPKTTRGQGPHFPRQITTRTSEDIEEFKQSLIYYVTSYLSCLENGFFPMGSVDSCSFWGGCQYLKICSSPSLIRKNIIEAEYGKK